MKNNRFVWLDDFIDREGEKMFKVSEDEEENHLKVMNMIYNKDSKGNFLIEDLVRDHKQWEYNQRWMKSIFNLVKKRQPLKDREETEDKHKVIIMLNYYINRKPLK